ncbi:MAG: IS110 family transposase [Solirubrobacteraceae bacterium]
MRAFAGVDWAAEKADICVQGPDGQVLAERAFAMTETGIVELCHALIALKVCRVAIERPDGVLVERLLEAGLCVLAIHPNQVKAARPRFTAAGGKSDRFDAFVLAELARTDSHRFRALTADGDDTKALRALTRARDELVDARTALCNQLREQLLAFWPGATVVFADLDSPIALAFIERYPSPLDARGLGPRRLQAFLHRHGYCGRQRPETLLAKLRAAPTGRAGELETDARRATVLGLIAALRPIVGQIRQLTSQIHGAVRAHPDGPIFLPLFRDKKTAICPATLIAELGDQRARYPTSAAMLADAGQSPVAVESGKRKVAVFRRACDKRLRNAVCTLADSTRHWHPWAAKVYADAYARHRNHQRAIRTLGAAWLRVLWRCWHDHTPYDPTRHGALTRQLARAG